MFMLSHNQVHFVEEMHDVIAVGLMYAQVHDLSMIDKHLHR